MPKTQIAHYLLILAMLIVSSTESLTVLAAETQVVAGSGTQTASEHSDNGHTGDDEAGKLFNPSADSMADLETTLQKATAENKLALIVFGANWCHDSRALAERMQHDPLKSVINDNYETLLVNVGALSEGRDAIQSLGVPIYYATPTVLIVDPVSRQLINQGNRHMWGNAANISMQDSIDYFQTIANESRTGQKENVSNNPELQNLLAEIEAFELIQAERLSDAYIITGAMLENDFDRAIWSEVGKYRNSVAADVDQLRAEANRRIEAGESNIELDYPVYPPWSWTSDAN